MQWAAGEKMCPPPPQAVHRATVRSPTCGFDTCVVGARGRASRRRRLSCVRGVFSDLCVSSPRARTPFVFAHACVAPPPPLVAPTRRGSWFDHHYGVNLPSDNVLHMLDNATARNVTLDPLLSALDAAGLGHTYRVWKQQYVANAGLWLYDIYVAEVASAPRKSGRLAYSLWFVRFLPSLGSWSGRSGLVVLRRRAVARRATRRSPRVGATTETTPPPPPRPPPRPPPPPARWGEDGDAPPPPRGAPVRRTSRRAERDVRAGQRPARRTARRDAAVELLALRPRRVQSGRRVEHRRGLERPGRPVGRPRGCSELKCQGASGVGWWWYATAGRWYPRARAVLVCADLETSHNGVKQRGAKRTPWCLGCRAGN